MKDAPQGLTEAVLRHLEYSVSVAVYSLSYQGISPKPRGHEFEVILGANEAIGRKRLATILKSFYVSSISVTVGFISNREPQVQLYLVLKPTAFERFSKNGTIGGVKSV